MPPRDWDARNHDKPQIKEYAPSIPRHELPSLAGITDAEQRFYLTMYLRGARDEDQAVARERCAAWGIDYRQAKAEADRT